MRQRKKTTRGPKARFGLAEAHQVLGVYAQVCEEHPTWKAFACQHEAADRLGVRFDTFLYQLTESRKMDASYVPGTHRLVVGIPRKKRDI